MESSTIRNSEALLRLRRDVSLAEVIRQEIEHMIDSGALNPGEWVNEATLAARFGVSRGPVREACRGLEQTGRLVFIVNRGAFVREVTEEEAAEIYDLRAVLFGFAGRLLAPKMTEAQHEELAALVTAMDEAALASDIDRYYPLNLAFHQKLVAFAGNRRLAASYERCVQELHLFRRRALIPEGRMACSNDEHKAILAALAARRPAMAERLMTAHVLRAKARILGDAAGTTPETSPMR
ncbi:MAG TPA: FCD domain-containing protein [Acetobacteraceae bacterium]|jgi:DNA-binding GntR family transcriptional regulator|nr:FCD domain-containing protein [Acetobacteraceae bacterium]